MTKFYYPALFAALVLIHSVVSARSENLFSNVSMTTVDQKIDTKITLPRKPLGATISLNLRVGAETTRLRSEGARLAVAFPFQSH